MKLLLSTGCQKKPASKRFSKVKKLLQCPKYPDVNGGKLLTKSRMKISNEKRTIYAKTEITGFELCRKILSSYH